jgi:hypothetical protein
MVVTLTQGLIAMNDQDWIPCVGHIGIKKPRLYSASKIEVGFGTIQVWRNGYKAFDDMRMSNKEWINYRLLARNSLPTEQWLLEFIEPLHCSRFRYFHLENQWLLTHTGKGFA